jgi:hypothetical protein
VILCQGSQIEGRTIQFVEFHAALHGLTMTLLIHCRSSKTDGP